MFPKPLQDLFATKRANRWQVLLPFSVIYLALGLLGTMAEAATSFYEFPLLDVFWLLAVWLVVILGARLMRPWLYCNATLSNLTLWLAASAIGTVLSIVAVWLVTRESIPADVISSLWLRILVGFVNLGSYLVVISAVFNYLEITRMLRRELARLVVVRATIVEHLASLKAKYLAEVEQKIMPVLADIQNALRQQNADSVVSQARAAIEDVVLPIGQSISAGPQGFGDVELPTAPSGRLRLRQFFDSKVNLQHAFVPLFTGFIFIVSILPAFEFFYGLDGLLAGLVSLAIILFGQFLIANAFSNRRVTSWLALVAIVISSSVISAIAGLSIQLFVVENMRDIDAFLTLGTWLVVFLISLIQLVITLTANYLEKIAQVQSDYVRSLQKRDLEIRQLQRRVTSFVHGDVQGKLRAVLLRVKTGGLTSENQQALEADLAHVQTALRLLGTDQPIDFFEQVRGLQDFWRGVCELKIESSDEAVQLLAENTRLAGNAFEVLSEAVANAIKHAEAEEVKVSLRASNQLIELHVTNSLTKGLSQNPTSGVGGRIFERLCESLNVSADEHQYQLIAVVKG